MSLISSESYKDQNFNPNRLTTGSLDESRQNIDRKYSLHDNALDESANRSVNQSMQQDNQVYYGIGYGQNEEVFHSPDFNFNNNSNAKKVVTHEAINQSPEQNQRERQNLVQQINGDQDRIHRQMSNLGQSIELVKSTRKSTSNQWTLRNGVLAGKNMAFEDGDHYDYLNGETLISHNRNPTNMRSQGNYNSRPNSNIAVATQLANGAVSAGGFDHDIECEETDFKYLEEVISKVKEGTDQQFHLSDYLEAMLQESQMEQTEEWDAIIAEAKEMQKTLKKVLDISFFLLERTQISIAESKNFNVLNSNLLKEVQIAKDHNDSLSVELKNSKNKIRQQYDAIKTQEDNIKTLNEQIQQQLDLIRRLEKSSIVSNTQSFGYANMNPALINAEQQEIINQHVRKINELETYLAEQTSSYHSEVYKNEKIFNKVKEYQHNEELLNIQIFQLERFKEEKDAKIFKLKDTKKRLKEELIRKDMELKNILKTRIPSNIKVKQGLVQLSVDTRLSEGNNKFASNDLEHLNQSYNTNIQENTLVRHQRKGFNLCGSQQKWSQELDFAVNKLRESKSGFLQKSFIVQQNIKEFQKAHHKRMQTISSNEFRNSHSDFGNSQSSKLVYSPYRQNHQNKTLMQKNGLSNNNFGSAAGNKFFNDSGTEIKKVDKSSPEYQSLSKRNMARHQFTEESKFDMNDHISPRKSNIYSDFNEQDDEDIDSQEQEDDVVELNSLKKMGKHYNNQHHVREKSQQSNLIGINESDLMEFNDTSHNNLAATLIDQSNFDHSHRLDESQRSIKQYNGNQKGNIIHGQQKGGSSATTKDTKEANKQGQSIDSNNKAQIVTVNNYNITQNIDINNFLSDAQQNLESFQGSSMHDQLNQSMQFQQPRKSGMRQPKFNESSADNKNSQVSQNQPNNNFDSKISLKTYTGSMVNKQIFEMQSFGMQQAKIQSPKKNQNNMEELKLDFYNQKVNEIKIGTKLDRSSLMKQNNNYNDIHCITVDGDDLDGVQRTYHISQLDQQQENKSMILQECMSPNLKIENVASLILSQKDALLEYFMITVLAFILKHPKRTTLMTIDKLKLYQEAKRDKIPFFKWNKWVEKRMIQIYQDKKRSKKAQLRSTFFDPKSWFGLVKINHSSNSSQQKFEVIDNHFQTL